MADKDYSELGSATSASDSDLVAIYPVGGPLKKFTWAAMIAQIVTSLGGAFLVVSNNLSDLASASSARANLGLGTAAQLASSALFQVANNLSEVANAATARANIGAAASASPTITGGMTYSGSTKQNIQALAALDCDLSLTEFFTKSISANSTFTFSNPTAAKAGCFIMDLTISSAAVPTWPANVIWDNGNVPTFGNGRHLVGFISTDGGTTWFGKLGIQAAS